MAADVAAPALLDAMCEFAAPPPSVESEDDEKDQVQLYIKISFFI